MLHPFHCDGCDIQSNFYYLGPFILKCCGSWINTKYILLFDCVCRLSMCYLNFYQTCISEKQHKFHYCDGCDIQSNFYYWGSFILQCRGSWINTKYILLFDCVCRLSMCNLNFFQTCIWDKKTQISLLWRVWFVIRFRCSKNSMK